MVVGTWAAQPHRLFDLESEMEVTPERCRPVAVFMAFGTTGDVYPIAAVPAAFACDQLNYDVVIITQFAHRELASQLADHNVRYCPVSSPPVLSPPESSQSDGSVNLSFCIQKGRVKREHRRECLSIMEGIFGDGASLDGGFLLMNFFALEGWSLADFFHVRCVVAAPYVLPPLWQFSCNNCRDTFCSARKLCSKHTDIHAFEACKSMPLVFVGLSSAGNMGFFKNPMGTLRIWQATIQITKCRFIFFTAGYEPLNVAIKIIATERGFVGPRQKHQQR